jgi:hypothetical protein
MLPAVSQTPAINVMRLFSPKLPATQSASGGTMSDDSHLLDLPCVVH